MSLGETRPSRRRAVVALSIGLGAIVVGSVLSLALPAYIVFVATSVLVAMISLLGLGVVTGSAGMIALCQLSFAAIGAWILEFLYLRTSLADSFGPFAFVVFMLIAAVVTGALGLVVGLPALRLRGVNLAVITLGVAAAVDAALQRVSFPDQWDGIRIPRPFDLAHDAGGDRWFFVFAVVVTVLVALVVHGLQSSRWGASWKSVAFSERGTASAGTSVRTAKLSAFALSAFLGGIAGCLTVGQIGQVNYITFSTLGSLGLYVLSIVVGSYLIDMALLGGILFVGIPEILKQFGIPLEWANIIYGVLGVQALTTGSNLGADIRRILHRRRRSAQSSSTLISSDIEDVIVSPPTDDSPTVLNVAGLSVSFGAIRALDDVTLSVREKEIVGLIGPNGAGKSTFVDAVTGFLPGQGGTVFLGSTDLTTTAPHRRARAGLRRTYQQDRVPPSLSVGAYARFVTRGEANHEEVSEALAYFGCPPVSTPLSTVDVGTRRLIEVAANMAARPRVIILDEPAAGLSHEEHVAFAKRLRGAPERFGTAIVLIEHDLDLVRSTCSTLVVLNFGQIIAVGPQAEVLGNPTVIAAYMGESELM